MTNSGRTTSPTAGRWTKLYGSLIRGDALDLTRDARLLGIEAETWCDDHETDGRIPTRALRTLTDADEPLDELVAELVATGRWLATDAGWTIAGFVERHGTSEERALDREAAATRLRGYRAHAKGNHNADGPGTCDRCRALKRSTNSSTYGSTYSSRTEVEAKRSDSEAKRHGRKAPSAPRPAASEASVAGRDPFIWDTEAYERKVEDLKAQAVALPRPAGAPEDDGDWFLCIVCGDSTVPFDDEDSAYFSGAFVATADGRRDNNAHYGAVHARCAYDPAVAGLDGDPSDLPHWDPAGNPRDRELDEAATFLAEREGYER